MKYLYKIMAVAGLAFTLVPPILFYAGTMTEENMKLLMFIGALIWFSGAIPWLGKKNAAA